MLLRDLKMAPRAGSSIWRMTIVPIGGGNELFIQIPTEHHDTSSYPDGYWWIYLRAAGGPPNNYGCNAASHRRMTEFEAQAVLDHYLQLYGVTDEAL